MQTLLRCSFVWLLVGIGPGWCSLAVAQVPPAEPVVDQDEAEEEDEDEGAQSRALEEEREQLRRRLRIRVRDISRRLEIGEVRAFALMDSVPDAVDQWIAHADHKTPERKVVGFSGETAPLESLLEPVLTMPAWTAAYAKLTADEQQRYTEILEARTHAVSKARAELVMAILEARLFLSGEQVEVIRPHVEALTAESAPESTKAALDRLMGRHQDELGEVLSERQFRRMRYADSVKHARNRNQMNPTIDRKSLTLELDLAVDYIAAKYSVDTEGVELIRDATRRGIEGYKNGTLTRKRGLVAPKKKKYERAVDEILGEPVWEKLLATVISVDHAAELVGTLEAHQAKQRNARIRLINAQLTELLGIDKRQADSLVPLLERGMAPGTIRSWYRPQIDATDLSPINTVAIFVGRSGLTAMKDVFDDDQDKELDLLVQALPDHMIPEGQK